MVSEIRRPDSRLAVPNSRFRPKPGIAGRGMFAVLTWINACSSRPSIVSVMADPTGSEMSNLGWTILGTNRIPRVAQA
jgi:hypothetical protein